MITVTAVITHDHDSDEGPSIHIKMVEKTACNHERELAEHIKLSFDALATGSHSVLVIPDEIFEEATAAVKAINNRVALELATLEPGRRSS